MATKEAVCLRGISVRDFLLSKRVDLMLDKIEQSSVFDVGEVLQLYNDQCLEICRRLRIERLQRKKNKKEEYFLFFEKSFLRKCTATTSSSPSLSEGQPGVSASKPPITRSNCWCAGLTASEISTTCLPSSSYAVPVSRYRW